MENTYHNKELNIYVQIDSVKSMTDAGSDQWVFEGIASTADMDLYNEVVYPESFLNSIEFFKSNGKIFFDHDYAKSNADWLSDHGFSKEEIIALRTPIGKPLDARITSEGLYIKAILNKAHPMAQLMWNQYLNNEDDNFRDQIGLSIGAKYLGSPRREFDVTKGKHVTYLPDLLLYEVSMTPEPVNPHTRSWASVMKSFMSEVERSPESVQKHVIPEHNTTTHMDGDVMVIKSMVEGEDGIFYELENRVNLKSLKEGSNPMEEPILENVVEAIKSADETMKAAPMEEEQPQPGQVAQEMPQDQEGGEPEAMGAPEGEAGEEDAGGEEASSVLEELVSQSDEEGQGEEGEGGDSAQEMVLDKLDAVLDTLSTLAEMMQQMSPSAPAEDQVTQEAPIEPPAMKSFDETQLAEIVASSVSAALEAVSQEGTQKSVEISDDSVNILADAIKSSIASLEERVMENIETKLASLGEVAKSVSDRAESPVVHPGTIGDSDQEEVVDSQVMKSVRSSGTSDMSPEKMATLKSMAVSYGNIRGYTTDKAHERAKIVERAQEELGIHPTIFQVYVNKAAKGLL